ncbi:PilN domain-containing protein [Rarobacter incanus]|uniref:Tfp pilus assembly protein PilN n=1 Tax=Rarobacter incanus TaxID=153494 RepID=A0A542SMA4_9MICO|nr:hypothetical protein [Rarobacter incanus]TQK75605.1 Tfp pilus assembly protein PilN [Rarobacter incanus]
MDLSFGKKKKKSGPDQPAAAGPEQQGAAFAPTGLPQVDLLPPEVRDGRRLGARRRILTYAVLGVLAAVVLAIGGTYVVKLTADNRLEDANNRSTQLAAEKKKYSEVVGVIKSIDSTKKVRDFSVVTEINWADYIDAIASQLPDGVTIDSFDIEEASPTDSAPDASDPTLATGLGTITFVATSPSLPDASDWADALNIVPGLQDATIIDSSLAESVSGSGSAKATYSVNVSVQVNAEALAHREFNDTEVSTDGSTSSDKDGDNK